MRSLAEVCPKFSFPPRSAEEELTFELSYKLDKRRLWRMRSSFLYLAVSASSGSTALSNLWRARLGL